LKVLSNRRIERSSRNAQKTELSDVAQRRQDACPHVSDLVIPKVELGEARQRRKCERIFGPDLITPKVEFGEVLQIKWPQTGPKQLSLRNQESRNALAAKSLLENSMSRTSSQSHSLVPGHSIECPLRPDSPLSISHSESTHLSPRQITGCMPSRSKSGQFC
jgi:hypothetical protein